MEFRYMFKTSPDVVFAVDNRTIGENDFSYFSTSAYKVGRGNKVFDVAGQAQEELLDKNSLAKRFYDKWEESSFKTLNKKSLDEVLEDIKSLKEKYLYTEITTDTTFKGTEYSKALVDIDDVYSLINERTLDDILSDIESRQGVSGVPVKELDIEL